MGSSQSTSEKPNSEFVRIERSEIPEEYTKVGVSSEVIKRVSAHNAPASGQNSNEVNKLKSELEKEKHEKARLREEMVRLTELQKRNVKQSDASSSVSAGSDIEERKKIFDETVERVQKQFFSYHRENVCQDNESEIIKCLSSNPNRVLKCAPLSEAYEKCVGEFRQQVLKGN